MEPFSTDDREPHLAALGVKKEEQTVVPNVDDDEEEPHSDSASSDTSAASTAASDAEQDEEDDMDADEEGEDDGDESDEEEEEQQVYPLPPLPPVHAPSKVHGIATAEVYSIIRELRRQMDDPVEREHAKAMLQGDTDVLLAVAQVLQEAHLLRRATVNDHGVVEEQLVPQPVAAQPSLPTGYNSWILEAPARARR
ncbi:hypothetical protein JKF63_03762 [Porcisia hertigi]|uniref:Uncharacterized protein n=1 Tax=Porcisia hertigi TaxID=2761500 RepID=A0A836LEY4_9TRYP|nr:hypothetical protein JKF63_03762 [Porcisia hertigi]